MPRYCDTAVLERNWFYWLLSSRVPSLEEYRRLGLLWTKVVGIVKDKEGNPILSGGKTLPDPSYHVRRHCLALANPVFFDSDSGEPEACGTIVVQDKTVVLSLQDVLGEINLLSDSWLHGLDDNPFAQRLTVIPQLQAEGYIQEKPTSDSWHAMLEDVRKMCHGIATRFKPRSEEEHHELTQDALLQVVNKMANYKLVYTPGRAPVFNLLTTTIHRCLYSTMNRRKHQREGVHRLLGDAQSGALPQTHRSLRTQTRGARIKAC